MGDPAGRLDCIMNLLVSGILCKCRKTKYVEREDGLYEKVIVHRKDCKRIEKAKELLNG